MSGLLLSSPVSGLVRASPFWVSPQSWALRSFTVDPPIVLSPPAVVDVRGHLAVHHVGGEDHAVQAFGILTRRVPRVSPKHAPPDCVTASHPFPWNRNMAKCRGLGV